MGMYICWDIIIAYPTLMWERKNHEEEKKYMKEKKNKRKCKITCNVKILYLLFAK